MGVTINFEESGAGPKRKCGTCTLCCRLVPVVELEKRQNQRCKFQRHSGCQVYKQPHRGFPLACELWSCKWLLNHDAADLRRPDRSHYVIDIAPDYVQTLDPAGAEPTTVEVIQIWFEPAYPGDHRDPALRAWLERRAAEKPVLGLVRYSGEDRAIVLYPPVYADDGQWHEVESKRDPTRDYNIADVAEKLGGVLHAVIEP